MSWTCTCSTCGLPVQAAWSGGWCNGLTLLNHALAHDLDALAGLIRPTTRLLYLNQPHNPTGTLMPRRVFEDVIELARAHGLVRNCQNMPLGLAARVGTSWMTSQCSTTLPSSRRK